MFECSLECPFFHYIGSSFKFVCQLTHLTYKYGSNLLTTSCPLNLTRRNPRGSSTFISPQTISTTLSLSTTTTHTHTNYNHMPEFFNIIVSMSRLLFSSPAFVNLAERSLSGARQVQDSSGEMCSSPVSGGSSTIRGVRISIFGAVTVLTIRLLLGSRI